MVSDHNRIFPCIHTGVPYGKKSERTLIAPDDDAFDGRAYYAGRTFMLNNQRILFGWVPTRANETDSANLWYRPEADKEDFIWAGTFCTHELYQKRWYAWMRIPDTVWNAFKDEKNLMM